MERNLRLKNFSKIWVYLARFSLGFGSFKKYCSVYYWKLPKIQNDVLVEEKASKVSLRKLFFGHCVFSNSYELMFTFIGQFCKIDINFDHSSNP